jgi:hypothetical protein
VLNPNLISTATTISILNKDNLKGLEIDEERKIVNGSAKFSPNEVNGRGLDRNLQVKQFSTTEDTKIVQVRVGVSSRIGMLKPAALAADFSKPPVLIDSSGQRYAAVGYVYKEQAEYDITFLPASPSLGRRLPTAERQPPGPELILVYRVSAGPSWSSTYRQQDRGDLHKPDPGARRGSVRLTICVTGSPTPCP